jgi:LmbE family N-acetylglucosaminyl deacetylase
MNIRLMLKQWIDNHFFGKSGKLISGGDSDRVVVFAPHQDDETLGCGGTIIKKIQRGSQVWVVYMTDGSRTNNNHIHQYLPTDELIEMRRLEALQACAALGVVEERVSFLGYEDSTLCNNIASATQKVRDIVSDIRPTSIFIPYRNDGHPDHEATAQIAMDVLMALHQAADVYEYPAWFWNYWPMTKMDLKKLYREKRLLTEILTMVRGLKALNCTHDIQGVLDQKRNAIMQHRSQMQNIVGSDSWGTLPKVGDGEWFKYFFKRNEVFCYSRLGN